MKVFFRLLSVTLFLLLYSCRSTKFVPENEYLLSSANVKTDAKGISAWEMESYIKQKPNFKTFEVFKLPLTIYNLSGQDTTKWLNKVLRNAGEPPVIYDSTKVNATVVDLQRMMTNKGYLNAKVASQVDLNNKKAKITYNINAGQPYTISDYKIDIKDSIIGNSKLPILPSSLKDHRKSNHIHSLDVDTFLYRNTLVKSGSNFDLDMLDEERTRIVNLFRRTGYYAFNKDYIRFVADTIKGDHQVELELVIDPYSQHGSNKVEGVSKAHSQYVIDHVYFYIDYNPLVDGHISNYPTTSQYDEKGYTIKYGPRGRYIRPSVVLDNCYIVPGHLYNESMTALTYNALSQLKILKNININFVEVIENDSSKLICTITCVPDKKQGISAEIEGTNSGGYLGVGGSLGYLHRNAFKGSEQFGVKVIGAYEAITSSFSSFDDNYFEIGGQTTLTFPRFLFPFLKSDFRRKIHASTQFAADYSYQRRPGYFTRTVLSSSVKYIWYGRRSSSSKHTFDLIDVSYVRIPELSTEFKNKISKQSLLYSFSDQFIASMGYSYSKTNANPTNVNSAYRLNTNKLYSFRGSIESAGNTLALIAAIADLKKDTLGSRKIFGTHYVQYLKGTADYSETYRIDEKNSIAWRLGGGVAYPYGNWKQIPIQKRFFAGGANSVRGWGVRELGPGSFYDPDANFYQYSGDIRLDANVEYRSKVFWIIELAAFIDMGNVWTIKEYKDQPRGQFKFNSFYKEIAAAWGLGIRFDFDFVLLRLDCGWKAYDPAHNPNVSHWRIKEPYRLRRNTALHLAVGYPF